MMVEVATSEDWRDIPGWEGFYQVSNLGRVRSLDRVVRGGGVVPVRLRRGKVLKQLRLATGYMAVRLQRDGQSYCKRVHRIVCKVFHGPQPSELHEVAHADGTRDNNAATNLRWATKSENALDRIALGLPAASGTTSVAQAKIIKRLLGTDMMKKDIAEIVGVSKNVVSQISRGKSWAHLTS
jgi:hypothetical protein